MSLNTITPAELTQKLSTDAGLTVIDVRTPGEFNEVHATVAKSLPLPDLSTDALRKAGHTDLQAPVYLLCQTGRRAGIAAETLSKLGYANPVVVTGGTVAWAEAGFPVARTGKKAIGLERQVRIAAGSLVFTGVILSVFVNHNFIWLSGFVGAGLVFAGITDICAMGLLIAKAPWNRGGTQTT